MAQIGLRPVRTVAADINETPGRDELPRQLAERLARAKAEAVRAAPGTDMGDSYLLAADTVVACGRRILPKPADEAAARACLDLLSGRRHRVMTGVAVVAPNGHMISRLVVTTVAFKGLSRFERDAYLASGEWQGKAGAYAIQGRAAMFVAAVHGSYSNVVGLPLYETAQMLAGLGYPVWTT